MTVGPAFVPGPMTSSRPLRVVESALAAIIVAAALLLVAGPVVALAASATVTAVLAMVWRADVATILFAFLFYANVLVVASRFHGVPTALASTAALLLLVPIFRSVVVERSAVVITPTLGLMFVFLISMMISTAASPVPQLSLPAVGSFAVEGIVLYVLVSNVANDVDRVRAIVRVLVIAGVFMAALSVFQELTRSYENDFAGFAQVSEGGFEVDPADEALRQRLAGPIGEQNRYAQVLLMVVPLAYFAGRSSERKWRALWYSAALLISAGVFLTFSRGAAVASFAVLLLMVAYRVLSIRRLVAILVAGAVLMLAAAPDYVLRITSLGSVTQATNAEADVDGAIRGRTAEALAAINVFVDHPIIGVGPDRFFREFSQIEANKLGIKHLDTNRRSHNLYLELAADLGVIGLATFIAIMTVTIVQLGAARRRWAERDPQRADLAAGLMFALYSYAVTALFLQLSYQRYLWAIVALANGLIWCLRDDPDDMRHLGPVNDPSRALTTGTQPTTQRGIGAGDMYRASPESLSLPPVDD